MVFPFHQCGGSAVICKIRREIRRMLAQRLRFGEVQPSALATKISVSASSMQQYAKRPSDTDDKRCL
jgi:hypothetical protein